MDRIAELESQLTVAACRAAEVREGHMREVNALKAQLAAAERERDELRACHEAELGVCKKHCPELQAAESALAQAREAMYAFAQVCHAMDAEHGDDNWSRKTEKMWEAATGQEQALSPAAPASPPEEKGDGK